MNTGRSLRASDADRERIISRLHAAATEGRIAADELEQRVSAALKALTYGDLDACVADLPSPGGVRRPQRSRPVRAGAWAVSAVRANPLLLVFMIPAVAVTIALLITAVVIWVALMAVGMALGGRGCAPRLERLTYGRDRRMCARRPTARSYWA